MFLLNISNMKNIFSVYETDLSRLFFVFPIFAVVHSARQSVVHQISFNYHYCIKKNTKNSTNKLNLQNQKVRVKYF